MTQKIVTVVGARPQFIKAATVSRVIRESGMALGLREVLVHTGQHYDDSMSRVFFEQMDIPVPAYNLGYGGGGHGEMTGKMLAGIERVLMDEQPDWVLIYGDTNSTLAGALAAVKLHIPVAHVEAGLRSFNMRMPEEVNRILADRVSSLLFCPTAAAVENLEAEGIRQGVYQVGDVMYDASLFYRDRARQDSRILDVLGISEGEYVLATCHRAENTDNPLRLRGIVDALSVIAEEVPVVLPIHPRTRAVLSNHGLEKRLGNIHMIEPVSYLDMVRLEQSAKAVVTDSGGVQKEAFFYSVPCLTLRNETEWVETVDMGWNVLCGANTGRILDVWKNLAIFPRKTHLQPYGYGDAAKRLIELLVSHA
jgi:UDP-GlcNAc3NAcA epimerase